MKTMLRFPLIFGLAVLSMVSCKKEDSKAEAQLVGKWHYEKADYVSKFEGEDETSYSETPSSADYMQFNANGTFNSFTKATSEMEEDESETGSWAKNGNKLVLSQTMSGITVSQEMEIKALTSNSLVIYFKIEDDGNSLATTFTMKK